MMSFIDLHNHCFTAMDDGVQTDDEALMMLHSAIKSDIKIMYVTPHREPKGRFDPENEAVLQAWKNLKKLAGTHNLDIDIRYGEEFRIKTDSIELIKNDQVLCYSNTEYILIEFTRTNVFSKLVDQAIELLLQQGKKILIAHPERYFDDIDEAIKICKHWVKQGCFLQINRTSLTGFHGIYAEKIAHKLIKLGYAHVVASDAHEGAGARCCRLDDVYYQIVKKHSQAQADMLLIVNPTHLSNNEPMELVVKPKKRLALGFKKVTKNQAEKKSDKTEKTRIFHFFSKKTRTVSSPVEPVPSSTVIEENAISGEISNELLAEAALDSLPSEGE